MMTIHSRSKVDSFPREVMFCQFIKEETPTEGFENVTVSEKEDGFKKVELSLST